MSQTFDFDVFLSHSHNSQDKACVRRLAKRLRDAGLQVWFDEWVIKPGDDIYLAIERGLEASRTLVLCLSNTALKSDWVGLERSTVLFRDPSNAGRRMIPLLLSECDMPDSIRRYQYVNYREESNSAFDELLTSCKRDISERSPEMNEKPKIYLAKLPLTSSHNIFGRQSELDQLDKAWATPSTNIVVLCAWGGVGKTALVTHWLNGLQLDDYRGARWIYAESFYSRGPEEVQRTSADGFLTHALQWFGETKYDRSSAWDKGIRLAELMRHERGLLILDGLETLQYPPGELQGRLKDRGMQALLREIARGNSGLVIVTTRVAVGDLRDILNPSVGCIELEHLAPAAGAELLRSFKLTGTEKELEDASRDFKGHALALTLLGSYLAVAHEGDVRRRDHITSLEEIPEEEGRHARRVMESYEHWLDGKPELEILRLLSLFDHPADAGALQRLRSMPAIPGVTSDLCELTEEQWKYAVKHLRELRLVDKSDQATSDAIDCHPLVREHFGALLKMHQVAGWKEAHGRLFQFYLAQAKKRPPETLKDMEPIFRAIVHGCLAGNINETLTIYVLMIQRNAEINFCCKVLGAIGADLAALSAFFKVHWTTPVEGIDDRLRALLIGWAGYRLQALGRTREALGCNLVAREMLASAKDPNAHATTYALSQLSLSLGDLPQAIQYAKEGVADAALMKHTVLRQDDTYSILAQALHQSGEIDSAEKYFQKAESIQKSLEPRFKFLYSVRGYFFCDLLLDQGKHEKVYPRARHSLQIAEGMRSLLDVALAQLTIGRSALIAAKSATDNLMQVAEKYLDQAVRGLIEAGTYHHIPRGLLVRSQMYRIMGRFREAWRDLDDMFELTDHGEMKLYLVDFHLEALRILVAEHRIAEGFKRLDIVSGLITECGYRRRLSELESLRKQFEV